MSYELIADKLEVRSALEGKMPEYIVKGYALVPNVTDLYKYEKSSKGYKSFKSMFTQNAIDSLRKQVQTKNIFVDANHELAANMNIKQILNQYNPQAEDFQVLDSYLKMKQLPLAKLVDFSIDDKGFYVDTRLNPSFRDVDADHQHYFDAVWNSMKDGFLKGMSVNFQPTKVVEQTIDGEQVRVIDDLDLYGISYVANPSVRGCDIVEVCMRSVQEVNRMEPEVKIQEKIVEKVPEAMQKELEQLRAFKEQQEKQKVETEKQTYQNDLASLKHQVEEQAKKLEQQNAKGVVSDYSRSPVNAQAVTPEWVKGQAEKIIEGHINWKQGKFGGQCFDGFGQLIQLQADTNAISTLPPETQSLLGKSPEDIIAKKRE